MRGIDVRLTDRTHSCRAFVARLCVPEEEPPVEGDFRHHRTSGWLIKGVCVCVCVCVCVGVGVCVGVCVCVCGCAFRFRVVGEWGLLCVAPCGELAVGCELLFVWERDTRL
jgi:hypothetical protein